MDGVANEAINRLVNSREMAVVEIDTRLDAHSTNHLRSAGEIESLIARVEVLLTTRLHGLVLALKNGVPAIAIDPEPGGAKIRRQAELLGWPTSFVVDELDDQALQEAFQYCLTDESRAKAQQCREHAQRLVSEMHESFVAELRDGEAVEKRYRARIAAMRQGQHPIPSARANYSVPGSPASWWRRLKKDLQKRRRRNKDS
jgi:polysaccharide pyruvyl transferase WcaK-like protein